MHRPTRPHSSLHVIFTFYAPTKEGRKSFTLTIMVETSSAVPLQNLFFTLPTTHLSIKKPIRKRASKGLFFFVPIIGEEMDENERKLGSFARNNTNISMEISIAEASSMFPGFRFSPTDEELIQYYLRKKLQGSDEGVEVIPEVDICRHEPWDLPAQAIIQSDNEWFFFSPRGRKYPNGSQSKRATESGYWKATGKERSVKSGSNVIGTKRTLVFHTGRAPKGQRTEWIMHEYCTSEKSQDAMVVCRLRKNSEFHLNDNLKKNSIKDLPAVNNSMTGLSCGEQSGMVDGAKPVDSCSKDCTSSYNSHSVEQVDTGAESDDKQPSDFSQDGCSSLKKDCADEEDCYADIMKDDIVKLDEHPGLSPVPVVKPKSELRNNQATVSLLPFQGTANRRLRLRRHRIESYQEGQMEIYKFVKQNIPIEGGPDSDTWQRPESLIHNFTKKKIKFPFFLLLLMLILMILFLSFIGGFLADHNG